MTPERIRGRRWGRWVLLGALALAPLWLWIPGIIHVLWLLLVLSYLLW